MTQISQSPTADFTSTTLNGSINDSVTTITVNDASKIVTPTYAVIDREDNNGTATPNQREVVYVSSKSGNDLTVTRGVDNSTARSHNDSAKFEPLITVGFWDDFYDAYDNEHVPFDGSHDITKIAVLSGATVQTLASKILSSPTITTPTLTAPVYLGGSTIAQTGTADHLTLVPGASKLVKLAQLRQDNTTDTYTNNSVILTGWGFILGNTSVNNQEIVNFGYTFTSPPVVLTNWAGYKDGSDPANLGQFLNNQGEIITSTASISTTGFFVKLRDEIGTMAGTTRFGYTWMAIGA